MSGALLGRGDFDWIAGGNSPIKKEILLPDGNWKVFELEHEIQQANIGKNNQYETSMCVSYSKLKAIAKILTLAEQKGLMSKEQLDFLKDYKVNGKYNFSERFTGTLGETTAIGAYQFKVANAIKNFGLIPQSMFPLADNFQDNIDKKFITEEMYAKGKEWAKLFPFNYEWVNDFDESLKYSPTQAIVRFANYNKPEDILAPEGNLNHAVCGVFATPDYNEVEDSYYQRYKRYNKNYTKSFMACYITFNNNMFDAQKFIKENDTNQVRNTNTGAYGVIYAGKLMEIKAERAGLYMIDRDARGLIGKGKTVSITNAEWEKIKEADLLVNF